MYKEKKILVILLSVFIAGTIFMLINELCMKLVNTMILGNNSLLIYDRNYLKLAGAAYILTSFLYGIYLMLNKAFLHKFQWLIRALLNGFTCYAIAFLVVRFLIIHSPRTFWISLLPVFVTGFLIVAVKEFLTRIFFKKKMAV
jgi:hypothetical protein